MILRCGVQGSSSLTLADKILNLSKQTGYSGLLGLFHISMQELMKIHGIGKVKAIQLKCIGELSKRMATAAAKPEDVYKRQDSQRTNPAGICGKRRTDISQRADEARKCSGTFRGKKTAGDVRTPEPDGEYSFPYCTDSF